MDQSERDAKARAAVNAHGPTDGDRRPRMVPETDVAPVDSDARATSQNAGSPGTQAAEFLAGDEPGDHESPPALPRVAREAGLGPAHPEG